MRCPRCALECHSQRQGGTSGAGDRLADQRRARHLPSSTPRTRAAVRLAAEGDTSALALLFTDMKQAAQQSFLDKTAAAPSIVLAIDQGEELFNRGAVEVEMFLRLQRRGKAIRSS